MKTVLMTCGKSLLKKGALATTDAGWGYRQDVKEEEEMKNKYDITK